jgi:hypothetical protein
MKNEMRLLAIKLTLVLKVTQQQKQKLMHSLLA